MPKIEEVKQTIRDAFALVEMPLDHQFIDCSTDNDPFYRIPWEVVPRDVIDVEPLMFSPKGYQYYLPAFLFNALNGGNNEHIMANLCPYKMCDSNSWAYFLKQATVLTTDQTKAILLFLKYIQETGEEWDREDAKRGIDVYWSQAAEGQPPTLEQLIVRGFVREDPAPAVTATGSSPTIYAAEPIAPPQDEPEPSAPQRDDEPPKDFF